MADWYPWFKVVHVVAAFAWMAGLFYLPRLFVYHASAEAGAEPDRLLRIMERRLLKAIMNPAAIVTWVFGLMTASSMGWLESMPPWLMLKALLVACLTGFHVFLAVCQRKFEAGRNCGNARFFRIINEVPTVLLIGIVILVVTKPFG